MYIAWASGFPRRSTTCRPRRESSPSHGSARTGRSPTSSRCRTCSTKTQADLLAASRTVVLGRGLPGSGDVGGADFDLLVDGCLIDVKATKDVGSLGGIPWAWQLLGYTLLDYEDALKIRSVALYLARQGLLLEWPLGDFCEMLGDSKPSPLADLRRNFRRAVKAGGRK